MRPALLITVFIALTLAPVPGSAAGASANDKLTVAVTLRAYYSWTARIGGDRINVVPMLPEGADTHTYQPRPSELARLQAVDALVLNGAGHDAFADTMFAAAGASALQIRTNVEVPLIRSKGGVHNSHSFLSLLGASQQIHTIARALGQLDPAHASEFEANARAYVRELRVVLQGGLNRLATENPASVRVAAVHEGYAYLLEELGLTLTEVLQPRHGVEPSARQLADSIQRIQTANIQILFTEAAYGNRFAELVRDATGTQVVQLRHLSSGAYAVDGFETAMAQNVDAIVSAVRKATSDREERAQ